MPRIKLEGLKHSCDRDVSGFLVNNSLDNCGLKRRETLEAAKTNSQQSILDASGRRTRRWYMIVIVLLYVGLITSFCLNVSLLLKNYPENSSSEINLSFNDFEGKPKVAKKLEGTKTERSYTTPCLVEEPCPAGRFYSCSSRECLPCSIGSFQPEWGQTSCWPCPPNTTTDGPGTPSPDQCKHTECVHRSTTGLAIVESPNYPAQFPVQTSCHWKVQPGHQGSLLLILPSLSLPPHCSHTLSVRKTASKGSEEVFSSCSSTPEPILLTAEGGELWVDFTARDGDYSAGGFQLSLLSIPDDLRYLIDGITGQGSDSKLDRIRQTVWGNSQQDKLLINHLLHLLSANGRDKQLKTIRQDDSPLIEVVEERRD